MRYPTGRREFLRTLALGLAGTATTSLAATLHAIDAGDGDILQVPYVRHRQKGRWGFYRNEWMYYGGRNMRRFLRTLQEHTNLRVAVDPEVVSFEDKDGEHLPDYPILFMTSNYACDLSEQEGRNMREYLLRGGFLIADDCVLEGTFSVNDPPIFTRGFIEAMKKAFPERTFEVIPNHHPVYHCFYDFENGLPPFHPAGHWEGLGLFEGDRLMVLLSPNDLCCGWQFNWGELSRNAYRMGINVFVYALTH